MMPDIAESHHDALDSVSYTTPTPDTATPPSDLSVREAVRRAVAELGPDAELDDVLAHLHTKFALTPPRGTAQTYLCLARKDARDAANSEPRRRGRPRKTAANGPAPPAPALDDVIEAVEILRDLLVGWLRRHDAELRPQRQPRWSWLRDRFRQS
ncbi:MAG: hypothetical protein ACRDHZ_20240, partial [Ktedonobacteraceae bacterium]